MTDAEIQNIYVCGTEFTRHLLDALIEERAMREQEHHQAHCPHYRCTVCDLCCRPDADWIAATRKRILG